MQDNFSGQKLVVLHGIIHLAFEKNPSENYETIIIAMAIAKKP
jgi:hypothetical protein